MTAYVAGFAGDWHGNRHWAVRKLAEMAEQKVHTVYHAGDFGLWPGSSGKQYLRSVHRALETNDQRIFVVLGNHEDYDRVALMRIDEDGWLYLRDYPRLRFAPRGHTWEDHGVRMAALGGAGSIDRAHRRPGVSWWPEEEITDSDAQALVDNVAARGWDRVDVLITHDAPAGLRRPGMQPKPSFFTPEVEHYTWTQRVRLRESADQVRPRWLVHGHWHTWHRDHWIGASEDENEFRCEVVGLTCDEMERNAMVADLVPGVGLVSPRVLTWRHGWVTVPDITD